MKPETRAVVAAGVLAAQDPVEPGLTLAKLAELKVALGLTEVQQARFSVVLSRKQVAHIMQAELRGPKRQARRKARGEGSFKKTGRSRKRGGRRIRS